MRRKDCIMKKYKLIFFFLIFFKNSIAVNPLDLVKKFIPENPVILEAGAHVGKDTERMSRMWPKGEMHAFEPNPKMYKKLKGRVKKRRLKNVSLYDMALSSKTGFCEFWVSNSYPGSSSLLEREINPGIYEKNFLLVKCITIDDWVEQNNIKRIDFMWLDMEGYELFALKSSLNILSTVKVIHIEVNFREYWKNMPMYEEVKTWIEKQGFIEIWKSHTPRQKGQANVIFVRE